MAKKSNTLLYVGLGAAALFLYMRSKGAKLPFTSAGEDGEGEAEEGGTAKRGRVEVGPTETLSESEYYGQPSASPISRLRQKVQATAEDIESIRETGAGLFTGGGSEGGGYTSPADFAVKQAIINAKKAKRAKLRAERAARIAKRRAERAARAAARRAKRKLRRTKRKLRRGKLLGELNVI